MNITFRRVGIAEVFHDDDDKNLEKVFVLLDLYPGIKYGVYDHDSHQLVESYGSERAQLYFKEMSVYELAKLLEVPAKEICVYSFGGGKHFPDTEHEFVQDPKLAILVRYDD